MVNVLITSIGGDIGQGVLKSVRRLRYKVKIIGADTDNRAAGLFLCDKGYILPSAVSKEREYIKKIKEVCRKEKIDIAFICHEKEQYLISSNLDKLNRELKTYFVVQPRFVLDISMDKYKTFEVLSGFGIRTAETAITLKGAKKLGKKFGYPLIIKARKVWARKGNNQNFVHLVRKIQTENELKKMWGLLKDPVAQEYITNKKDEEYTVGIFLDNKSKTLGAITMLRKLRFGLTWTGIADSYPDVEGVAIKTAEAIKAIGPCNIQLRRDKNGKPCVIEINGRISSTTAFRSMLGFNEASAAIDYFIKDKISKFKIKKGFVMKIWGELIVPIKKHVVLKNKGVIYNKRAK